MRDLIIARIKEIIDGEDELLGQLEFAVPINSVDELDKCTDQHLLDILEDLVGFHG
jgi:hypothetical protein